MRKKLLTILVAFCLALPCVFFISSCTGEESNSAQKLSTPFVSISSEGVASWNTIPNAVGYTYKINGGNETNTLSLSVQLQNGDSIVVKAVADGVNYLDSNYSNIQTYTTTNNTSSNTSNTSNPAISSTSSGNSSSTPTTNQLTTPQVSISSTGLASWNSVANAVRYAYKINNGAETYTTELSVQLVLEQSISVKAVGDGINYTDSDYSVIRVYTTVTAPTFLRIDASLTAPNTSTSPTLSNNETITVMDITSTAENYFANADNSLSQEIPTDTNYFIYAQKSSTIYVQIWLDNPDQCEIFSVKVNGTRYQIGGGLQSYFNGGTNCIYIQLTTPSTGTYKNYTVEEIKYVDGINFASNGLEVFIGDNDTVTVGLNYSTYPYLSALTQTNLGCYNVTYSYNFIDSEGVLDTANGWLRALIWDGQTILAQQQINVGENNFTFDGLTENKMYQVAIVGYYDMLTGNGLQVVNYGQSDMFYTKNKVEFDTATTKGDYYTENGENKAKIDLTTILYDTTLSYEKIAIYIDDDSDIYDGTTADGTVTDGNVTNQETVAGGVAGGVITTPSGTPRTPTFEYSKTQLQNMGFNGNYTFTDGILSNKYYVIRVYYTETDYVRYVVKTPAYSTPRINGNAYVPAVGFVKDLMIPVDICRKSEVDRNVTFENYVVDYKFTLKAFKDGSATPLYSITYDPNNTEDFFDSGIDYYYSIFGIEYLRDSYYLFVRNYFIDNESVDGIVWKGYIEADLNDGNGTQTIEYSLSVNIDYNDMGGHYLNGTVDTTKNEITIIEESEFSRGYISKISLFNENYEWVKDVYVNNENTIDDSAIIQMYLDKIAELRDNPDAGWNYRGDESGKGYWWFTNPYADVTYRFLYDSDFEAYFDSLNHTAEQVKVTVDYLSNDIPGGYYHVKAYGKLNSIPGIVGSGYEKVCMERSITIFLEQLATPIIVKDDNNNRKVYWEAVENAVYYDIYINGEFSHNTWETYVDYLNDNDVVQIMAIAISGGGATKDETSGDGPNSNENTSAYTPPLCIYTNSGLSNSITIDLPNLATPTITNSGTTLIIQEVENANMYILDINNGEELREVGGTEHHLQVGTTVRVKAVNQNGDYGDSEWSNTITISYGGGADGKW